MFTLTIISLFLALPTTIVSIIELIDYMRK